MWRSKDSDEESIKCPVCPAVLGKRNMESLFAAHCEECKATYTWRPGVIRPTVIMDKDIKRVHRYCDKNGCYCRS